MTNQQEPMWGPYVSDRAWGTVREDYSEHGTAWSYFPHDHARSKAYRWGEDGIAGISDNQQLLCFAPTFWNGKDAILKERLFGLGNEEGNHGEDVKELYFYLENTPDHSWMKCLYRYPHAAFPYSALVAENGRRSKLDPEYELLDTGAFDEGYFDIEVEYAKNDDEDILVQITAINCGEKSAPLYILPTIWFRNQWSFGLIKNKPSIQLRPPAEAPGAKEALESVVCNHSQLGSYYLYFKDADDVWFTENETNYERLFGAPSSPRTKDLFHEILAGGKPELRDLARQPQGTKCAPVYHYEVAGEGRIELRLRLSRHDLNSSLDGRRPDPLGTEFDHIRKQRRGDYLELFRKIYARPEEPDLERVFRQALSGLLWNKQFYYYTVDRWLNGDPGFPTPPEARKKGRNAVWKTLNNRDILSMPDKWEYPWYASWDLAYHTVPFALIDPHFAKQQLITITREWYMHPDGQIPAYEWNFNDANPPIQAWAALKIYQLEKRNFGTADTGFLKRIFNKLLINFTWWVNRKDVQGLNVFEGGFLGLDNIGIFDRSAVIPGNAILEQADGTAWMAQYALNMLDIALEIAEIDPVYEDVASKFYEHFLYIAESYNQEWNEEDHFFYDILVKPDGSKEPVRVRSLVGVIATFAVSIIKKELLGKLESFAERMRWFSTYRKASHKFLAQDNSNQEGDYFLSLIEKSRLVLLLNTVLNEDEFLSPFGLRSLSKHYLDHPYSMEIEGSHYTIGYEPAEASSYTFGGNSNWRGPIWMPLNFSFIEALKKYHDYYGDSLKVECPTGSGTLLNLLEVARLIRSRLLSIFTKDASGRRPVHGSDAAFFERPGEDLLLFYEYFHAETGKGMGASHQTGWTALVANLLLEN